MNKRGRIRLDWLLGVRYLRSTRGRGFVSFISVVSMAGLALGVAVLVVVLSVMNGFEYELRTRILHVTSHATLMGLDGRLVDWRAARQQAEQLAGVVAAAPYIESQAMLARAQQLSGTVVRGIDPAAEQRATGLAQTIGPEELAQLQSGSYRIVLGDALASAIGAGVGDEVVLMAPEASVTPAGLAPRMRRFTVAASFHTGMYEFDRSLALIHIADAARVFRLGSDVTGIRLALTDPYAATRTIRALVQKLDGTYLMSTWINQHADFFRSIATTKTMMFLILSLLVAIAAFNSLATLVMVVKDKRTDIAILRTMGAAPRSMLGAFAIQGCLIGLVGVAVGAALGVLLASQLTALVQLLEQWTGLQFLDAKLYFMTDLPARVQWRDVLQICAVALALCALATLYPAWRAAATQPAEALRHD